MTIIQANCPSCGEVDVRPADVSLHVCVNAPLSTYAFTCPGCQHLHLKPATAWIAARLRTANVQTVLWKYPVDVPAEALEPHLPGVLSLDDCIDFHASLDGELERLLRGAA